MAKQNKKLAEVFHFDLQGKRDEKYAFLNQNSLASIQWNKLEPNEPNFFLVEKNFDGIVEYEKGFKVDELFKINANGVKTQRDDASIFITKKELTLRLNDFINLTENELKSKYKYADVRDWKVNFAKEDLSKNRTISDKIMYRPFDFRYCLYTGKTKGIMGYPRFNVMQHFVNGENLGIVSSRQFGGGKHFICFISSEIIEISSQPFAPYNLFPLYLYPESNPSANSGQATQQIIETSPTPPKEGLNSSPLGRLGGVRTPNLNAEIVKRIAEKLGLTFTNEPFDFAQGAEAERSRSFAPIDILDYIYAVLHSPTYREKYKEFLKIDFPRVPYPKDKDTFWQLVKLGGEIRQIHLLESPTVERYITQYPIDGDNVVIKPRFISTSLNDRGRVYINDTQYFDHVPETAWNFFIGGYQPAQKWLKDRKDRKLEFEDILHYQKIIVALSETDRLMKEIDKIEIE